MYLRGLRSLGQDYPEYGDGYGNPAPAEGSWTDLFKTAVNAGTDIFRTTQQTKAATVAPRPVVPYPGYSPFPGSSLLGAGAFPLVLGAIGIGALLLMKKGKR